MDDTIIAPSSAVNASPRAILRLSGSRAIELANHFLVEHIDSYNRSVALRARMRVGDFGFEGTAYVFRRPNSATGEDVVEFHIPGNSLLVQKIIDQAICLGARAADPGEFTARAYFNRRIDLVAAEGIAASISATNRAELAAARRLMSGTLSERIKLIVDDLTQSLALLELGMDFSDEDVTFLTVSDLLGRIEKLRLSLAEIRSSARRSDRISREPTIALVGRPNAGKSTLLNALAGHKRAVVSSVPGTTRDAVSVAASLKRGIVRLIDTAGFEEDVTRALTGAGSIQRQMQAAASKAIETADLLVLVQDITDAREPIPTVRPVDLVVLTKTDLLERVSLPDNSRLAVAAAVGQGMDELRQRLDELSFGALSTESTTRELLINARHAAAIDQALLSLNEVKDASAESSEIRAWHLRSALNALGSISGMVSADDVLGRIFSAFCIGK